MIDNIFARRIAAELRRQLRENAEKGCYVILPHYCERSPIKAHSISKEKHLAKISVDGQVLTTSPGNSDLTLVALTGKSKATTFPGFCDYHDKIFHPIDEHDYAAGDKKYEFLCAMRASARELYAKGTQNNLAKIKEFSNSTTLFRTESDLDFYKLGVMTGYLDLKADQKYFNHSFYRNRYDRIRTVTIKLNKRYPVVASSMFMPQVDFEGNMVNNLQDLKTKARPLYFTLFPQGDETIALISYKATDEKVLGFIKQLTNENEEVQKTYLSNMIAAFMENFAVSPEYWHGLPDKVRVEFENTFTRSITSEVVPFMISPQLNIFI